MDKCPKCRQQVSNIYSKSGEIYEILKDLFFCSNCELMFKPQYKEIEWK